MDDWDQEYFQVNTEELFEIILVGSFTLAIVLSLYFPESNRAYNCRLPITLTLVHWLDQVHKLLQI